MIPRANIIAWREYAPWLYDEQIEQDLILSRIIVEIFNIPELAAGFAQFEKNLYEKFQDHNFLTDIDPLLPETSAYKNGIKDFIFKIYHDLISKLPGESWRGMPKNYFAIKGLNN